MQTIRHILKYILASAIIVAFLGIGKEKQLPGSERVYVPDTDQVDSGVGGLDWEDSENIAQMVSVIEKSRYHGLEPENYNYSEITALLSQDNRPGDSDIRLDSLLTDAFYELTLHLGEGVTDPDDAGLQWAARRRQLNVDRGKLLDSALKNNHIPEIISMVEPDHQDYHNLKLALAEYYRIEEEGGWEEINPDLPRLSKGMVHPAVPAIRNRLSVTQGDIVYDAENENLFDENLHEQVLVFQRRNGIPDVGIVGEVTIEKMNVPVHDRIDIIKANLERWRWLAEDMGERYIEVDIAGFYLRIIDNDSIVFDTDIIVGRPDRQTPVLSEVMTYLVLNPKWWIPPGILERDIIPSAAESTSYLDDRNMLILDGNYREVDPDTIDWDAKEESEDFPYQVVQEPGIYNEMGRVKFMFPNPYLVYIHDSPHRNLFNRHTRIFSSGCIRISEPFELIEYLFRENLSWDLNRVKNVIGQANEREVGLVRPIDVHLLYFTARADEDGTVYFREDIYDRDKQLLMTMFGGYHDIATNPDE
jgi:L,D-transpeptidase YcbB